MMDMTLACTLFTVSMVAVYTASLRLIIILCERYDRKTSVRHQYNPIGIALIPTWLY